jgi:tetratricopeptide repeat protein
VRRIDRHIFLISILAISGIALHADDTAAPSAVILIPSTQSRPAPVITGSVGYLGPLETDLLSGAACLRVGAALPLARWGGLSAQLGLDYLSVDAGGVALPISASAGGWAALELGTRTRAIGTVGGGGYLAPVLGTPYPATLGGGPSIGAEAALERFVAPAVALSAYGRWTWHIGLGHLWSAGIGVSVPTDWSPVIEVQTQGLGPVFPALSASHRESTIGSITIRNDGRFPVVITQVSASTADYAPEPTVVLVGQTIGPGESLTVPVDLEFGYRLMQVTGDHDVRMKVSVGYEARGGGLAALLGRDAAEEGSLAVTVPVHIHDRNSIVWDDNRKACLFVTEKDPSVIEAMSQALAAVTRRGRSLVTAEFRTAVAALATLEALGMVYAEDPTSPYAQAHSPGVVDYLRFPRETISAGIGDCDDLSVLYCALLESIGVRTALVTVPGHIFTAVCLNIDVGSARRLLTSGRNLLSYDGLAWVPLETTITNDFARAWQAGWEQWRTADATGQAGFYPVAEGWGRYPPVALQTVGIGGPHIDSADLDRALGISVEGVLASELEPMANEVRQQIASGPDRVERLYNRLGIIYARFGQLEDAAAAFRQAVRLSDYELAVVNLANALVMLGEYREALDIYQMVYELEPMEAAVVLGISTSQYRLGNYRAAREAYDRLEELDSVAAARNAYLAVTTIETAGEARAAIYTEELLWQED